jgi:hypothetical protein
MVVFSLVGLIQSPIYENRALNENYIIMPSGMEGDYLLFTGY